MAITIQETIVFLAKAKIKYIDSALRIVVIFVDGERSLLRIVKKLSMSRCNIERRASTLYTRPDINEEWNVNGI